MPRIATIAIATLAALLVAACATTAEPESIESFYARLDGSRM